MYDGPCTKLFIVLLNNEFRTSHTVHRTLPQMFIFLNTGSGTFLMIIMMYFHIHFV
jgi:hypothetical protein